MLGTRCAAAPGWLGQIVKRRQVAIGERRIVIGGRLRDPEVRNTGVVKPHTCGPGRCCIRHHEPSRVYAERRDLGPSPLAQLVLADGRGDRGSAAEPRDVRDDVEWGVAKPRPVRQHVPEQFPDCDKGPRVGTTRGDIAHRVTGPKRAPGPRSAFAPGSGVANGASCTTSDGLGMRHKSRAIVDGRVSATRPNSARHRGTRFDAGRRSGRGHGPTRAH